MTDVDPRAVAAKVVHEATGSLTSQAPSPFSPAAFALVKQRIGEYVSDLIDESIKVSRRQRADTVSAAHVQRASEYLVASTARRLFRHLGTAGGILLGGSLSNVLAMTMAAQYTPLGTTVSVGLAVLGSFMVALHIAKD